MSVETHHARLLLALARGRWDEAARLRRAQPFDAEAFVAACRACDVPSWLHAQLRGADRLELIDGAAERLVALQAKIQRDNLLLLAAAEAALDALAAAGVTPIALKGLDLLHRLYPRFDLRTLDDFDLLLRPAELRPALAALRAAGWQTPDARAFLHYVRSSHHLPLRAPGPLRVDLELHWNLVQDVRYTVDVEGLFRRAVPLSIAGRPVLRLDDHDAAAHLLLHHFTHYFDRKLKWAVDLSLLARQPAFSWDAVLVRLRAWGATTVADLAAEHLEKLLPGLVPAPVREGLRGPAWRRVATRPLRSDHPLDLFRGTRHRLVQLYLAAVLLERPALLPLWIAHRRLRDRRPSGHPLEPDAGGTPPGEAS